MPRQIVMIGAFDTKAQEYAFLREQIVAAGHRVVAVNVGTMGNTDLFPVDVDADRVANAAGSDLASLRQRHDRGEAMKVMADGAPRIVRDLHGQGRCDAIIGMGGTGGTTVVTAAMRALPLGVPKVCISTAASGNTWPYVGTKDITMIPSIVDVAGVNRVSRMIFTRAAAAVCGMADAAVAPSSDDKPVIVASMFGNTTACVDACREALTARGYEVLVFHATGTGGRTMESLIDEGVVDASHAARNVYPTFAFTPVELVAVCDLDETRARTIGARFGARHVYTDMHKMLERDDLDAVFIVVGYDRQGQPLYSSIAKPALDRGLHVWMEKPPAARVTELRPLLEASRRQNKHAMVGFKKMFMPANHKAAELIRREAFMPTLLMVQYPSQVPTPEQFARYLAGECDHTAVAFLDHLCHPMSLILELFGAPQRLWFTAGPTGAGVATFEYDDGRVASLSFTQGQAVNGGLERTTIIGSNGQHVVVENNIRVTYHRNAASLSYGSSPDYYRGEPDTASTVWEPEFSLGQLYNKGLMLLGYYNEVNDFAHAALTGTPPTRGTLRHAAEATAVFEAFAKGPRKMIDIEYDAAFNAP
ncbi:MAG: Tm-1-like ATP-binding domain-containing protein [Phycisphaeraceae bacterium]